MGLLLQIYHALPSPLQAMAASVRGHQLRRWRYGPETDRLVDEALARESWTVSQWDAWREERLAQILHRAATRVPYYRELWTRRRASGDRSSWESLENWPILEKATVRTHHAGLIADDCRTDQMFPEHTSGTSGTPLSLWWSRDTVRAWYALFEARCRLWHGVSRRDRWGILGGQLVTRVEKRTPPFWVWNAALNQLYLSSYHLAPDLIPHYLQALERYRVQYLWGYSSALYELALGALRSGRPGPPMRVVLTNAEPLFDYQRSTIAEAFGCPVRETYGMAEIVAAASECPAGRLHLWPEVGVVEVNGPPGETGDLIATHLINPDMPLIRYRVGDRIRLGPKDNEPCPCGRRLPLVAGFEGRVDDVLYTTDGRRVGRLDPVFKADLPVSEAQIIQEAVDRIRVRFVPDANFNDMAGRSIVDRLRDRLGPVEVVLEPVDTIPRTASGKFRAVICHVPGQSAAYTPQVLA
jgi:phenylacetate-CoA ligase